MSLLWLASTRLARLMRVQLAPDAAMNELRNSQNA